MLSAQLEFIHILKMQQIYGSLHESSTALNQERAPLNGRQSLVESPNNRSSI